jgi:hypothetical protein
VLVILFPLASWSHHSTFGRFDPEDIMEIEGTVVEVLWRNPHGLVILRTDAGVTWELESRAAAQLERSGIRSDSIKPGDRIRVAGQSPLTAAREMFLTNILLPNGAELLLDRTSELRWTDEGAGIRIVYSAQSEGDSSRPELGVFRVWSFRPGSRFLFPEIVDNSIDVDRYPVTEAAQAALERFDRATDNPTRNCTPKGMPTIMEQPYPMEIVQDGDNILLRIEEYDTLRTVHMDRDRAPANEALSPLGYSVGTWDGTTLVVTTTHLNWPWFNQLGIPQSQESVLVERFTPAADGSRLDYDLTVTDPVYFTEPVLLERDWIYIPDAEVRPYECSEAAYQRPTEDEPTFRSRSAVTVLVLLGVIGGGILLMRARRMRQQP